MTSSWRPSYLFRSLEGVCSPADHHHSQCHSHCLWNNSVSPWNDMQNMLHITMTSQWAVWRLKSPASRLFTQPFNPTQIKESIKAPRHWPLCWEFTGDRPVNSQHKWPVMRKSFHLMTSSWFWDMHTTVISGTQRRHNERDGVSNHRRLDCLLKCLFSRRPKKTPKLRITGLCEGNSPVTGEFHAQRASNVENVSVW